MEQAASAGGAGCGGSPYRPRGGAVQAKAAARPARSRCRWPPAQPFLFFFFFFFLEGGHLLQVS